MLKLSELHTGAEVYWTDPAEADGDPNHMSDNYFITDILADTDDIERENDDDIIVMLQSKNGSVAEVFNGELT